MQIDDMCIFKNSTMTFMLQGLLYSFLSQYAKKDLFKVYTNMFEFCEMSVVSYPKCHCFGITSSCRLQAGSPLCWEDRTLLCPWHDLSVGWAELGSCKSFSETFWFLWDPHSLIVINKAFGSAKREVKKVKRRKLLIILWNWVKVMALIECTMW